MMRRTQTSFPAILLAAMLGVGLAQPRVAAAQPANGASAAGGGDTWLLEAQSLCMDRDVAGIARMADRVLARGRDGLTDAQVVRLMALREFGRAFTRVGRTEGPERQVLPWLLGRENLLTLLMLGRSGGDPPDGVLRVIARLKADHGEKVVEFAELATALALVYDAPADPTAERGAEAQLPELDRVSRLFAYYTNGRGQMRVDPVRLPWELAVFVVDTRLSEEEMAWAFSRYSARPAVRDAFYDVQYAEGVDYSSFPNGIPGLSDLATRGGTTQQQAYFAANVCRAVGAPAVALTGPGEGGVVRSWIGVLDPKARAGWEMDVGKGDFNRGYPGTTIDPQSGDAMGEAEVALLGELARAKPADRLTSMALVKLAEGMGNPRDIDPLIEADRAAMLLRAVDLSPGNRRAWDDLRTAAKEHRLGVAQTDALMAAVTKQLVPAYVGFGMDIAKDAVSWRGTDEQLKANAAMARWTEGRPDLQAKLLLARGDLLMASHDEQGAVAAWRQVATNAHRVGNAATDAMTRIEAYLRDHGRESAIPQAYAEVWKTLEVPRDSADVRATAFYRIGTRYADVLEGSGDTREASQVRARLAAVGGNVTNRPRR